MHNESWRPLLSNVKFIWQVFELWLCLPMRKWYHFKDIIKNEILDTKGWHFGPHLDQYLFTISAEFSSMKKYDSRNCQSLHHGLSWVFLMHISHAYEYVFRSDHNLVFFSGTKLERRLDQPSIITPWATMGFSDAHIIWICVQVCSQSLFFT